LLDFVRRHRGKVQIAYKIGGKPVRDSFMGAEEFLREAAAIDPEAVVVLDSRVSTLDLLRVSDCTLGFHTLGLIEAMFTSQPILYCAWGELFDDIKGTLMPFHESDGLFLCRSRGMLTEKLDQLVEAQESLKLNPQQEAARREFRETWYYKPDGKTAKRVVRATLEAIDEFRVKERQACRKIS
jgi:hypothetical protein